MRRLPPGTPLGPYVVEAELGRGGMGTVYRAVRAADGARLALKVLQPGGSGAPAERLLRFQREAELAARLVHPGIVRVHDIGAAGGLSYIAMDLIEGAPLSARVGRLAPLEAARLVAQVARAVAHAHAHGVVHRDLKPDNVLVRPDGAALVTDFGVARAEGSDALTRTGALVGTPTYLAPEQAAGRPASAASDVHALGAMLFEAITGDPPFVRDDLGALLAAIADETPRPPSARASHVPAALDRLTLAALAKRPEARPTAEALAAGLEAVALGRVPGRSPLSRALPALTALSLLLVVAALAHAAARPAPGSAGPASSEPPALAPATTDAAPPVEAPDPEWLAPLLARPDLPRLQAAFDAAADAPPGPAARARVLRVLADLDARWTEPANPIGPEGRLAYEVLVWTHALWRRLDPEHRPPRERVAGLLDSATLFAAGAGTRPEGARVARALVALDPEHLGGYVAMATVGGAADLDPALVRRGADLARAQGEPAARGTLLLALAGRCWDLGVMGREAAARADLVALGRIVEREEDLPGPASASVLVQAVEALDDPLLAARWLDLALARDPLSDRALSARGVRRLQAGDVAGALADGQAAQRLVLSSGAPTNGQVIVSTTLLAEAHARAGQPAEAAAAFERGMAFGGNPRPGMALRRILLLATTDVDPAALRAALVDLVERIGAHVPGARFRGATDKDLATLEAIRAAADELARSAALDREEVRRRLAPWSGAEGLRVLDM
ncbi:MAG: serine/threonine protein kinase [Planctomycetes bacterium]|nr:serine/threonine protein kinase [Planctomycetota bacterium]